MHTNTTGGPTDRPVLHRRPEVETAESDVRKAVDRAVGEVLFNVSNDPRKAQGLLLGVDTGPLREKVVDAVLAVLAPAPQPTTEPSKDDLLDTQAGLALAHQAWHEGYAAHRRATQEQESTGKWHTPSNPYFSALVHAPAPQPAADQRCTACDGRGDEGSTYMNSGKCQTCHGTGTQPAADTDEE